AKNPDFGAVITYYLKEAPKTIKDMRQERETKLFEKGERIPQPTDKELRAEREEVPAYLTFTITDEAGNEICRINKAPSSGINRINWDLRYRDVSPVDGKDKYDPFAASNSGIPVMPGKYKVSLSLTVRDTVKQLAGPVEFNAVTLNNATLPAADRAAVAAFQKKVAELTRVMQGTSQYEQELLQHSYALQAALNAVPGANIALRERIAAVSHQLEDIRLKFYNISNRPSDEENPPAPVTLYNRLNKMAYAHWGSTGTPTQMQQDAYAILMAEFPPIYDQIKRIGETDLKELEKEVEKLGAPATPGRLPEWKK
ncbi:MAG: glycosyl hydrolase, partial [Bacteroidota bacterium]